MGCVNVLNLRPEKGGGELRQNQSKIGASTQATRPGFVALLLTLQADSNTGPQSSGVDRYLLSLLLLVLWGA